MRKLIGYRPKKYTNKKGDLVEGYEVYFIQSQNEADGSKGYAPWLRWNQSRKCFENWFVGKRAFEALKAIDKLIGQPVNIYTDPDYGNIVSIQMEN